MDIIEVINKEKLPYFRPVIRFCYNRYWTTYMRGIGLEEAGVPRKTPNDSD